MPPYSARTSAQEQRAPDYAASMPVYAKPSGGVAPLVPRGILLKFHHFRRCLGFLALIALLGIAVIFFDMRAPRERTSSSEPESTSLPTGSLSADDYAVVLKAISQDIPESMDGVVDVCDPDAVPLPPQEACRSAAQQAENHLKDYSDWLKAKPGPKCLRISRNWLLNSVIPAELKGLDYLNRGGYSQMRFMVRHVGAGQIENFLQTFDVYVTECRHQIPSAGD
jgi:hypothetical protein